MNINIGQNIHDDKLFLAPYVFGFNPAITTSKFVKLDNNKSNNSNLFISNIEFTTSTQQTNFGKNGVFIGKGCTLYSDTTNDPELLIFGDNPISNGGVTPQSNGGGILLSDKMRFVTYKYDSFVADSGITSHLGQAISHSKKLQLNSVTRMVIDKDGKVGIGTDNPFTRLQIGNLDDFQLGEMENENTWDSNALTIIHQTPTTATILNDPKPVLYLGRDGTSGQAYGALATFCISRWQHAGTSNVGARTRMDIKLDHDKTGENTPTVMTMRSDGRIGIGTDNPGSKLTFETIPSNPDTFSWTNSGNTTSAVSGIDVSPRDSKFVGNGISWKSKYQSWGANDLSEGSSDNVARIFYQPVTFHSIHSYSESDQTGVGLYRSGRLVFTCGDNENEGKYARMVLNSRGNVGIGTDSPSALLHLTQNTTQNTTTSTSSQVNIMKFNVNSGYYHAPAYTYGIRLVQLNTSNVGTQLTYYGDSTGNNYDNKILTMVSNGYVGIGMIDPDYPLHVDGSASSGSEYGYHLSWSSTEPYWTPKSNTSRNISAKFEEAIWPGGKGIFLSSDRRIKENIVDVPDNLSLQILRDISCCYYEYRDKINRGYDKTIGFIAQQVREHLPIAVDLRKNIIPNIMKKIEEPVWTDISTNEYKLTISDLQDPSGNKKYRFYVSNNDLSGNSDTSGNKTISREEKKELFSLKDEPTSFIFDKKWENVFLYGEQVNDFHTIDKQKLFTVNFSATQEIDRIQQKHAMEIENLKNENAELKQQLLSIQQQLNQLLSQ